MVNVFWSFFFALSQIQQLKYWLMQKINLSRLFFRQKKKIYFLVTECIDFFSSLFSPINALLLYINNNMTKLKMDNKNIFV